MRNSGESTYTLIKNHHISSSTIDKLRHNKPLNTTTINDLCRILSCKVEDILLLHSQRRRPDLIKQTPVYRLFSQLQYNRGI
ncbi:helix-turn-helix domain-containing protein [Hominenteromicrobium sp.]|uniref:helix-turn-helix domain-containing protein n=1 Tax=Hominenteromicrobium sp. TaxID=3073581 RepID=UPI00399A590B